MVTSGPEEPRRLKGSSAAGARGPTRKRSRYEPEQGPWLLLEPTRPHSREKRKGDGRSRAADSE
jgi:hypothetical protein